MTFVGTSYPDPLLRASRPSHIRALTGVRAIAAGWVVAGHFKNHLFALLPGLRFLDPLLTAGYLGVDLFFTLSGFILAHNYLREFAVVRRRRYLHFIGLRFARMYPVHLFTLVLMLLALGVAKLGHIHLNMPQRMGAADFVRNFFMVHAWVRQPHASWNGPAWSISAEWFAYMLFPFLAIWIIRTRTATRAAIGATLCLALLLGVFAAGYSHPLLRVMCEFIAGCLLYRIYVSGACQRAPWNAIVVLTVAATVAATYCFPAFRLDADRPWAAPLMALLVLALAHSQGGAAVFLGLSPLVFLGESSYSLYMSHDLVRLTLSKLLPATHFQGHSLLVRLLVLGVYVGVISGLMVSTYFLVEVSWRRRIRRVLDRYAGPRPATAPAHAVIAASAASGEAAQGLEAMPA